MLTQKLRGGWKSTHKKEGGKQRGELSASYLIEEMGKEVLKGSWDVNIEESKRRVKGNKKNRRLSGKE